MKTKQEGEMERLWIGVNIVLTIIIIMLLIVLKIRGCW